MDIYEVIPSPTLLKSLSELVKNKAYYRESGAIKFRDNVMKTIDNLATLPQTGSSLFVGYKTKVIQGCILAYRIDEVNKKVYVFDIVDPTQDTIARKYR